MHDPTDPEGAEALPASPFADLVDRARVWLRWIGPARIAASIGAALVVGALAWWLMRSPSPPTEARLPMATHATAPADGADSSPATAPTAPGGTTTGTEPPIVVHVAGAVAAPGVYELAAGARVTDAIAAAGGLAADAAADGLNLAAPLLDGDRIGVPTVGDAAAGDAVGLTHAATAESALAGPINLNTATAGELDTLPGIGPATAAAIVDHRASNGPFASVDDLEAVRGIGPAKLDALRPLVTV